MATTAGRTTSRPRESRPSKPRSKRPAPPRKPASDGLSRYFDRHGYDLAGLALVMAGLVAALAIYGDLAGPAGRAIDVATATVFGVGRFVLPVALVGLGVLLLFRRPQEEAARMAVSAVLVVVAASGLLHLVRGSPTWGSPMPQLRRAAGVVGAAAAEPLRAVLATGGAAVVLLTLLGVGLLLLSQA
ncbi:MAG: DNA translocase FtsK 4TM domain-containing protein, partial [Actinomycetota bacterium]|nr:DNA translocase FtsK 4TM domain-containing protein [Actinomycetota bacterium]